MFGCSQTAPKKREHKRESKRETKLHDREPQDTRPATIVRPPEQQAPHMFVCNECGIAHTRRTPAASCSQSPAGFETAAGKTEQLTADSEETQGQSVSAAHHSTLVLERQQLRLSRMRLAHSAGGCADPLQAVQGLSLNTSCSCDKDRMHPPPSLHKGRGAGAADALHACDARTVLPQTTSSLLMASCMRGMQS